MKAIYIFLVLVLLLLKVQGQEDEAALAVFWNEQMKEIAEPISNEHWIVFKQELDLSPEMLVEENAAAFGLSENDELRLLRTTHDELGYIHYKYQQYHKGLKVEGAELILHEKNSRINTANGYLAKGLNENISPAISSEEAQEVAVALVQGESLESQLAFYNINTSENNRQLLPKLAYKVVIQTEENDLAPLWVYVDAQSGNILKQYLPVKSCGHNGTATTYYHGDQTITTAKFHYNPCFCSMYELFDCSRNMESQSHTLGGAPFENNGNTWGTDHQAQTTALWAVSKAWDYFNYVHYWGGHDGYYQKKLTLLSNNGSNAVYAADKIVYGIGNSSTYGPVASIDILAHEFTHGVIENTADFGPNGESGSLDEGYADIFGAMVENYVLGGAGTYIMGEQVFMSGHRRMFDPNQTTPVAQPKTYLGTHWNNVSGCIASQANQLCYRHNNSGVLSYWFYLLAEGGSGVNDHGFAYNVSGIGKNKASLIAFQALKSYLSSNAQYADVKNATIWTALEWYGSCSNELEQTIKAWDAVGVPLGNMRRNAMVDCNALAAAHNAGNAYAEKGFETISINCAIGTNNALVDISAGESVYLLDGFQSGPNFHAYLDPCFEQIQSRKKGSGTLNEVKELIETASNWDEVIIAPNPNRGQFTIKLNQEHSYTLWVYNLLGELIIDGLTLSNIEKAPININNERSGVYLLKLFDGREQKTFKVFKQ